MCYSKANGGRRCSYHTGVELASAEAALAADPANGELRTARDTAFLEHCTTRAGRVALVERIEAGDRAAERVLAVADGLAASRKQPVPKDPWVRVGLDLDGVTFNYFGALREHMVRTTGRPAESFPDPTDWSFVKSGWFSSTQEYFDAHNAAVNSGLFAEAELLPDALREIEALAESGAYLNVVTSRHMPGGDDARAEATTLDGLERRGIPYHEITFTADKAAVDVDVFIDDSPSNVEALVAARRKVLIFDQPYNRHLEGERVRSWSEVAEKLR